MHVSSIKLASFAVLPMLAQVSTCDPTNVLRDIFDPQVVLVGRGTLEASGTGTATLRGNGTIRVTTTERTGLVIFDAAGVEYELEGEGSTYWYQGHLIVDGMLGTASIEGDGLRVGLHGGPMEIYAEGEGRVTLSGEGTYSTNGDEEKTTWSEQEQTATYAAAGREPTVAEIPASDVKRIRDYSDLIDRVREALANPDVIVGGTGTLHAEGSGSVLVAGSGTVTVDAQGHSGIIIYNAAQVHFELSGEGRTQWRGVNLIAEGLVGTAFVEGEDLRVVVTGGPMVLDAEGTGRARLSGTGSYETNGEAPEGIPEEEVAVSF